MVLLREGVLSEAQVQQALLFQQRTHVRFGEAVVIQGFASPAVVGRYLERTLGFPFVDITELSIDVRLARLVPEEIARRKVLLPFADTDNTLHVAMADPLDLVAIDDLHARLHRRIEPHLAFRAELMEAINRIYDFRSKSLSVLEEIADTPREVRELSVDDLVGLAEDAPIVRLVNSILHAAINSGVSDIHIEPMEHNVRVRFRQDGLLHEQMTFPQQHLSAVVSRIKIMARMDIAERRRPQDGRFLVTDESGRGYDLRVSVIPLVYGEKLVMRVLAKSGVLSGLDQLGFYPEQKETFRNFISQPHGIVLVTGPTGSGKSTTLFGALNEINESTRNINTIEDPVEYHLAGINQMQVNPKIGVTFATGLRTLVRQDPDVIMVGEIRDAETAEIAIQAALTGHLVLSTLHTNDAAGAITRLQNMGVEPYLLSSALIGVVGQRLMRQICPHCKETYRLSPAIARSVGLPMEGECPPLLTRGRGCVKCQGRGLRGRTAIYEVMNMTDSLRDQILNGASAVQIKAKAVEEGMITLRQSAQRKVLDEITIPEEMLRVLYLED